MKNAAFHLRNTLWLLAALGILLAIGVSSLNSIKQIATTGQDTTNLREILTRIDAVLTALNEAESSQRGYILTSKKNYLDLYRDAIPTVRENLSQLINNPSLSDNAREKVSILKVMSEKKFDELHDTLKQHDEGGIKAALSIILTDKGKNVMDDARYTLRHLKEIEEKNLSIRLDLRDKALHHSSHMILIGSLVAFAFIVIAFYLLSVEFKAKKIAEQKALDASRMKSEFLANMSHEIRTPINGIIGMNMMLQETRLSHDQRDLSANIKRLSEMLSRVINDIFDISKIEAGQIDIEISEFDIEKVISDITSVFAYDARKKGVEFTSTFNRDFKFLVKTDPGRISQILNNLLSNAIKFTPGGCIELRAHDEVDKNGQLYLCVEVEDTGIGIAKEKQHLIFEMFAQADVAKVRRFSGVGLGLSISKKLVKLMGGDIGFKSEQGMGSLFWFKLPITLGDEKPQFKAQSDKAPEIFTSKHRILIAEDNFINQKVLLGMLNMLGLHGVAVSNGLETIEALEQTNYDVVLMDCQMPEMDGYEATQRIRASMKVYSKIPIIAITANALKGDRERCLKVGMNDYISKPVDLHELSVSLKKWLANNSSPAMDMDRINTLKKLGATFQKNLLTELVESFVQNIPDRLNTLRMSVENKNSNEMVFHAHNLKGAASNLGAKRLAELCEKFEFSSPTQDIATLNRMLSEIESAYKNACEILLKATHDGREENLKAS